MNILSTNEFHHLWTMAGFFNPLVQFFKNITGIYSAIFFVCVCYFAAIELWGSAKNAPTILSTQSHTFYNYIPVINIDVVSFWKVDVMSH